MCTRFFILLLINTGLLAPSFGNSIPVVDTTKPISISLNAQNYKTDSNVLVVVNDKVLGAIRDIKNIKELFSADNISRVNVIKDSLALAKYGEKGRYGVIEIYLKNAAIGITRVEIMPEVPPADNDEKVFSKVEIPPTFPGGEAAWKQFLIKNINALVPVDSGAPAGTYKVLVQFIVDINGAISNIKALTKHGYGMEKEAIRLIKKGPNWIPAVQNGRVVAAYVQQPVTFQISDESDVKQTNPSSPSTDNIKSNFPEIHLTDLKKMTPRQLLQLGEGVEIVSYTFTIDTDNGGIWEANNNGSQFNSATKNIILNATAGKMFTLDNIRVRAEGIERKIPSKVYVIIN